ncbi:sickle tail protein homolog isoform X1 [Bos mutus]|uniref:sickle tail protein homolog isoform X1 n=1 Tax=Bos mutus TaxID=72004 RepID=UPI0038B4AF33
MLTAPAAGERSSFWKGLSGTATLPFIGWGDSTRHRHVGEQGKSNLQVTSLEDAECRRTKERLSNGNSRVSASKSSRNIPRRHTLGGPRSSKEILGMQTSEMDRKREAFLEHLKQKYPHHATAIMGHQERLRDQSTS